MAALAFDLGTWAVCHWVGVAALSATVDLIVGLIGVAFALSLFTGFNLGLPESIRNVGGDAGSLVNVRGGLCLLLFSTAVLFVGPVISGLLP